MKGIHQGDSSQLPPWPLMVGFFCEDHPDWNIAMHLSSRSARLRRLIVMPLQPDLFDHQSKIPPVFIFFFLKTFGNWS